MPDRTIRRRNVAALAVIVLLVVLGWQAWRQPVGYTVFSPGPTVNVLGKSAGKQIIEVSGHRSYRDGGGLRLVTIIPSSVDAHVSVAQALFAWADPDDDVYPHDAVYRKTDTTSSVKQQSTQEMTSSQDNAVAAALRALHIGYRTTTKVAVGLVDDAGPSHDVLRAGDVIHSIDGTAVTTPDEVIEKVRSRRPGSKVELTVERAGNKKTLTVTTAQLGDKGKQTRQSKIGVTVSSLKDYRFPFDVELKLASNIGGPSAGLMFSLGIYDVLTPGSLTHDKVIAGTGEIDSAGRVGEIGGIQQKLVGAQHDGARLFLVPAGNCAEALGGHYDPDKMRLVRVETMAGALQDIKDWTANPDADLPRCTR